MRAVILLTTIIMISQAASITAAGDKGLIKCITNQDETIVDVLSFCKDPIAENAQCYNNY